MTRPYQLVGNKTLAPDHPLHWSHFWPNLQRNHAGKNAARQDLVLWLASLHQGAVSSKNPHGFCEFQLELCKLREWVRDYRPAFDYFFYVKQLGFNLDEDNREISTVVPKRLTVDITAQIKPVTLELKYTPPPLPENSVISKVYLQDGLDEEELVTKVIDCGRPELVPPLRWLFRQNPELNFHFAPSGRLKLRDTCVWPISGFETWPSWLRETLFGPGIDLDSAYVQFLLQHLKQNFTPSMMSTLFPDLLRLLDDKEAFRKELCEQVLQRPFTDTNRNVIKGVIMSIANGSKISSALLLSKSGFSSTAKLINSAIPDAKDTELIVIGDRLKRIADQFSSARKHVSIFALGKTPSRKTTKEIFCSYFEWERNARYAIWEAINRHGIMVHDGIDGVPLQYRAKLPELVQSLNLRLTS